MMQFKSFTRIFVWALLLLQPFAIFAYTYEEFMALKDDPVFVEGLRGKALGDRLGVFCLKSSQGQFFEITNVEMKNFSTALLNVSLTKQEHGLSEEATYWSLKICDEGEFEYVAADIVESARETTAYLARVKSRDCGVSGNTIMTLLDHIFPFLGVGQVFLFDNSAVDGFLLKTLRPYLNSENSQTWYEKFGFVPQASEETYAAYQQARSVLISRPLGEMVRDLSRLDRNDSALLCESIERHHESLHAQGEYCFVRYCTKTAADFVRYLFAGYKKCDKQCEMDLRLFHANYVLAGLSDFSEIQQVHILYLREFLWGKDYKAL